MLSRQHLLQQHWQRFDHIKVATTLELCEKDPLFTKDESDKTWV